MKSTLKVHISFKMLNARIVSFILEVRIKNFQPSYQFTLKFFVPTTNLFLI